MSRRMILLLLILLLIAPAPGAAQEGDECPAYVQTVLELVGETCAGVGRNEACYGHHLVEALFIDPAADLTFAAPSDLVPVEALAGLATGPLDLARDEWGVAVLNLQLATVPETLPGQATRFLIMGDTRLTDASADQPEPVSPFQAFYFSTGFGPPACHSAVNALVVKSPPDTSLALAVNNLEMYLGSTVVFTLVEMPVAGEPAPVMVVTLLEGSLTTAINGIPVELARPQPGEGTPLLTFAVTLNPEGWVDAGSLPVLPPDDVWPTVSGACENARRVGLIDDVICDAPLGPIVSDGREPGEITPQPPDEEPANGHVFIAWHNMDCEYEPPLASPVSFNWGVGCFDSAVHANAHPHPADYQVWLDRTPLDMSGLEQSGPDVHSPQCPWGWSFFLPPQEIAPGTHTLTIQETITDTWHGDSGGHDAGEVHTITCTLDVGEPQR